MWTKNGAAVKSTIKLLIVVVNNFIVNRERQPQRSFSVNYKNKALLKNIINAFSNVIEKTLVILIKLAILSSR